MIEQVVPMRLVAAHQESFISIRHALFFLQPICSRRIPAILDSESSHLFPQLVALLTTLSQRLQVDFNCFLFECQFQLVFLVGCQRLSIHAVFATKLAQRGQLQTKAATLLLMLSEQFSQGLIMRYQVGVSGLSQPNDFNDFAGRLFVKEGLNEVQLITRSRFGVRHKGVGGCHILANNNHKSGGMDQQLTKKGVYRPGIKIKSDKQFYQQQDKLRRMRFKINSFLPARDPHPLHQENTHNTESSYLARTEHQPLTALLRGLQALILGQDQQDQNLFFMMQLDEDIGSISIGFIKNNPQPPRCKSQPDLKTTELAITQYQQTQANLAQSLRSNMQTVKSYRQLYQKTMDHCRDNCVAGLANKAILSLCEEMKQAELPLKNRSLSQDTVQSLQSRPQQPLNLQPSPQFKMPNPSEQQMFLEFQEFQLQHSD